MTRPLPLALGVGMLALAWLGPAAAITPGPFSAHMAAHMLVVAVAAPLLAWGIAGGPLDPVPRAPALFHPVPASIVELVVVWAWHTPGLHHLARRHAAGLAVEQATFLASGLLVWLAVLGGRRGGNRTGAGVLALLLTSMHMTLLGALLALPPRPLFEHAHGPATEAARLADQHLGGAIMLVVGGVSYLAGGIWLAAGLLRRGRTEVA